MQIDEGKAMNFERYIHLERFGNDEVLGIEFGECWIFPKLDGTNGSVWSNNGTICTGSRNRKLPEALSAEDFERAADDVKCNDNQGFAQHIGRTRQKYTSYFARNPNHRLYGEWLVRHAFNGYRSDAWNRFYVFDVAVRGEDGIEHFIPFEGYVSSLQQFEIDYVLPQCKVTNPTYDTLLHELKENHFLCEDGKGPGEGIVIKNYGFYNKFGNQVWAKLVSNEYKEIHTKFHGVNEKALGQSVEEKIVEKFVTEAFVEKEFYKVVNAENSGGWNSRRIPELFSRTYHALITEEMWHILKEYGRVTINFGALYSLTILKIKQVLKEIF